MTFLEKLSNGGNSPRKRLKHAPGTGKRVNGCLDVYAQESGVLVIASREDVKEKKVETLQKSVKLAKL